MGVSKGAKRNNVWFRIEPFHGHTEPFLGLHDFLNHLKPFLGPDKPSAGPIFKIRVQLRLHPSRNTCSNSVLSGSNGFFYSELTR